MSEPAIIMSAQGLPCPGAFLRRNDSERLNAEALDLALTELERLREENATLKERVSVHIAKRHALEASVRDAFQEFVDNGDLYLGDANQALIGMGLDALLATYSWSATVTFTGNIEGAFESPEEAAEYIQSEITFEATQHYMREGGGDFDCDDVTVDDVNVTADD